MSLLFETIACLDGELQNLEWHQARLDRTYEALFPSSSHIDLKTIISIPDYAKSGFWKCRVTFDSVLQKIDFEQYTRLKVQTLKLVESNLAYSYKFSDRAAINSLFLKKGKADDILIIKNGLITDSSKANVLLFDGKVWYTPERPLLPGTMRAYLLHSGKIKAKPIRKTDLALFEKIMLISAMNPFDESRALGLPQAILD